MGIERRQQTKRQAEAQIALNILCTKPSAPATPPEGGVRAPGGERERARSRRVNKSARERAGPVRRTYLLDIAPRYVEERQQQLQLHLRLEVGEAVLDVAQDFRVQLGTYRAPRPRIIRCSELVVEPQARITVANVRHLVDFTVR